MRETRLFNSLHGRQSGMEPRHLDDAPEEKLRDATAAPPLAPLVPQRLSTRSLRQSEQCSAWADWFQPVFDVRPEPGEKAAFSAEYAVWQLDGIAFTTAEAPAARSIRSPGHIRRSPVDHWVISFSPDSVTRLWDQDRSLVVRPGVPILWSLGQPSDSLRMAGTRQQLYLPRDGFADMADLLDAAVMSKLETPLGAVLGDFMLSLQHRLPNLPIHDAGPLSAAIRALVAAVLSHPVDREALDQPLIERSRLQRLRKIVLDNLRSPQLGPAMLCRGLAVSRSSLYRLLDPYGGAARFILRARLRAARRQLSDPAFRASVAHLAEEFCFSDASAFARAYRREFGHSPTEARDAARHGSSLPSMSALDQPVPGLYSDALDL